MDIRAEKLELVQAILNIDDVSVIKKIKNLLKKREHDWFDDLTDEQQESIKRGLEEAGRGELISHKEAMARLGL